VTGAAATVTGPENPHDQLSRLSVTVFSALFLTGIAAGAVEYSHRSPVTERHVAATNAITIRTMAAAPKEAPTCRASGRATSPNVSPVSRSRRHAWRSPA